MNQDTADRLRQGDPVYAAVYAAALISRLERSVQTPRWSEATPGEKRMAIRTAQEWAAEIATIDATVRAEPC